MSQTASSLSTRTIRQSSWWKRNQQKLTPIIFLAPGLLFFVVYVIWPIISSLTISLYQWDGLSPKTFIGLENYIMLFDDEYFYVALWNNVKWLVCFMLAVPVGLGLAIFLNQTIFGIRVVKSLFFFPFVISQVVIGLIFTWFYRPDYGVIAPFLNLIGLEGWSILADEDAAGSAVVKVTLVDASSNIFVVDNQVSLSANEKEQVLSEPLIMMESEILKVQASSGNVDVIASVLEINREDR